MAKAPWQPSGLKEWPKTARAHGESQAAHKNDVTVEAWDWLGSLSAPQPYHGALAIAPAAVECLAGMFWLP